MSNHQTTSNKVVDGIDKVKNAFISGEPGTTGREPFEHSTASGPGANFATGHSSGAHSGTGLTGTHGHSSGTGLTGDHSHSHSSGTGLTGSSDRSHPTTNPSATGGAINTGLTGPGHHETGAAAGLHAPHKDQHQSNAQTSSAGNGAVGISGVGVDGLSRTAADKTTGYTGPNHNVDHTDREFRGTDNKGLMDKVKDALPGSNKDSTSTSHSTHDNSHSHSSTTGTGLAGSHSNTHSNTHGTSGPVGTNGPEKRGIVDKINDALPGTPAKTEQHYGQSNNPTTLPDHTSRHGAGTAYGAGPHGTSGVTDEAGSHAFPGSDRHEKDVIGGHHSGATGAGLTGASGASHREHGDRVGAQGQDSSKFEGNLNSGPRTSGAAGTDRFDSSHTGAPGNVGAGLDRQHDDGVHHDTSQRAPGKSSGGIGGALATSDKDFTGRERQGQGAYADTDGLYKLNSTGPAGNSALTGREGNLENNPVAQAKSREAGSTTTGTTNTHATEEHGEKKGLMAKVKDAFSS